LQFDIVGQCGAARAGVLHTLHGPLETPAFLPVGTQASVKGLTPSDLEAVGAPGILSNAYHLWLQPGEDLIARAGGLHQFMGWNRPIVTDSGGFQIMSLADLVSIEEEGIRLTPHRGGEQRFLTPESAVAIQAALGSDIAMALDVCLTLPSPRDDVAAAMRQTVRWAERQAACRDIQPGALFAIVQGGVELDLRGQCARELGEMPFDGYGIGGLSVGEGRDATWPGLEASIEPLPPDRPRYLMGVGDPSDLIEGIRRGVDFFDCVLPTRLGRHGTVLVASGRRNLRASALAAEPGPIELGCDCVACMHFSAAYLHHLFRIEDDLGRRLASLHNIRFLTRLVERTRQAILENRFPQAGMGLTE
jgi:queuine tRNA-ribosyltransferase